MTTWLVVLGALIALIAWLLEDRCGRIETDLFQLKAKIKNLEENTKNLPELIEKKGPNSE
jgi:hypothetical protein